MIIVIFMEGKYLKLEDLSSYSISSGLSDQVWDAVSNWDWFSKKTFADQFIRSVDSISANIAEGFGRYNKKDKIKFYRYSMGSQKESLDWLQKAYCRDLINKGNYDYIFLELEKLPREINHLIKYTNEKLSK